MTTGRRRALSLFTEALRWGTGLFLLARVRVLAGREDPGASDSATEGDPRVAVIIPARNEEAALPRLLSSLNYQTLQPAELLVIDDGSSDSTAAVARRQGATVLEAPPVPTGWSGKNWACHLGIEATTAGIVVFVDADTELAPRALRLLAAAYAKRGGRGLLSVAPEHVAPTLHERLSAVCQLVAMMGTGAFSMMPAWTATPAAFGPCMICRREDYDAAGGHAAVRSEMAEDMALARRFHDAGLPVSIAGGKGVVRVRMYPEGVGQLIRGWSRTLASGAASTRPLSMVLVIAWISGLAGATGRLGGWVLGRQRAGITDLARYAAYGLQVQWMLAKVGAFGGATGLAFPFPLAAFLVSFSRSVAVRRGWIRQTWKGRRVDLADFSRPPPAS